MALLFDSWLLELGAVLVALLCGLYVYMTFQFQHWKKKGLPYLEPSFPFGNSSDMVFQQMSLTDFFSNKYQKLEDHKIAGMYHFHFPTLLVRDPELIKAVLVKDFQHFHSRGMMPHEEYDPLSGNLFSMEGTKWKHLRYKLTPTFTSGKMKMMFPIMVGCGKELKAILAPIAEKEETIEIGEILARYSTDIIATCAFGIESNSLKNPDSEFRKWGKKIFQGSALRNLKEILLFLVPPVARMFQIPLFPNDLSSFFLRIVDETLEYREKFQVVRNDFMQLLINIKNKKAVEDSAEAEGLGVEEQNMFDSRGLTNGEIAAQVFVFFMAGFETSSTTMRFCLYELALNPSIQDRLRDEIDSVRTQHGGELNYDAIMSMEYLDRVVAETLRKYPPLPFLMRKCTEDFILPDTGVKVDKGTALNIPVYSLHHDPQYYPDPQLFDPDRFTEEAKSSRHPFVYLPFGEGPRICIGLRFGLLQTKLGIATVVSSYQVDLCRESTSVPLVMEKRAFILTPQRGVNLKLSSRGEQ